MQEDFFYINRASSLKKENKRPRPKVQATTYSPVPWLCPCLGNESVVDSGKIFFVDIDRTSALIFQENLPRIRNAFVAKIQGRILGDNKKILIVHGPNLKRFQAFNNFLRKKF